MKRKRCVAFLVTGKSCEGWATGKTNYCQRHQHLAKAARKVSLSKFISPELPPGENGFLFDSNSGNLYTLNRVGAFIVRQFYENKSIAKVVEALTETYDVGSEEALADVLGFVDQMKELGVGASHD
jgi:hypothetical protein